MCVYIHVCACVCVCSVKHSEQECSNSCTIFYIKGDERSIVAVVLVSHTTSHRTMSLLCLAALQTNLMNSVIIIHTD